MQLWIFFLGINCGVIEENGQVTEIVAAGGRESASVSIYNLDSGQWRQIGIFWNFWVLAKSHPLNVSCSIFFSGENLPTQTGWATSVPYQGTFLMIGGYCHDCTGTGHGHQSLASVLKYNKNGEWETLPNELAIGRYHHVAIPKPAC